jgi:hypothetical protein
LDRRPFGPHDSSAGCQRTRPPHLLISIVRLAVVLRYRPLTRVGREYTVRRDSRRRAARRRAGERRANGQSTPDCAKGTDLLRRGWCTASAGGQLAVVAGATGGVHSEAPVIGATSRLRVLHHPLARRLPKASCEGSSLAIVANGATATASPPSLRRCTHTLGTVGVWRGAAVFDDVPDSRVADLTDRDASCRHPASHHHRRGAPSLMTLRLRRMWVVPPTCPLPRAASLDTSAAPTRCGVPAWRIIGGRAVGILPLADQGHVVSRRRR